TLNRMTLPRRRTRTPPPARHGSCARWPAKKTSIWAEIRLYLAPSRHPRAQTPGTMHLIKREQRSSKIAQEPRTSQLGRKVHRAAWRRPRIAAADIAFPGSAETGGASQHHQPLVQPLRRPHGPACRASLHVHLCRNRAGGLGGQRAVLSLL